MSTWQEKVERLAEEFGTRKTSGYRSPEHNRAIGGAARSYHTHGTPDAPGAIDVGGPAGKLKQLFDEIKQAFAGRIHELYLNLPHGASEAIRENQALGTNPEAGRPQHLHIALGASVAPTGNAQPAASIPEANRGERALEASPADVCARRLCPPDFQGMINSALGKPVTPQPPEKCICWSDVWVYGVGLVLVFGGLTMVVGNRRAE